MKKIVYLVSIVCLMFYSCTKDDEKTLTLSENSVTFTSDGGEQQILVTANTNWEARSEADWIDLVTFGRTGNGTIVIKTQPNYPIARTKSKTGNNAENNYSTAERSAKVFVTTLLDGIDEEIIISQEGYTDTPFQVYHGNCPFKGNIDLVGIPHGSMASFDSPDGFPSPTFGIPEYPWKIIGEVKDGIMAIDFPEDKYELTPQYNTFTEGLIMSQVFITQNSNPFLTIRLLKIVTDNYNYVYILYVNDNFSNGQVAFKSGWNFIEIFRNPDWVYGGNNPFWLIGEISQDINLFFDKGYRWHIDYLIGPL